MEELAAEEATLVHDNPGSCASHCSLHSPSGAKVVDMIICSLYDNLLNIIFMCEDPLWRKRHL